MYKYMKNPLIIGKPSTGHIILISVHANVYILWSFV